MTNKIDNVEEFEPNTPKHLRISNELYAFLADWLLWAEGEPGVIEYNSSHGLCIAISKWCRQYKVYGPTLDAELSNLLGSTCYSSAFPFGTREYDKARNKGSMHKDPNRISWVKAALSDTLSKWEWKPVKPEVFNV